MNDKCPVCGTENIDSPVCTACGFKLKGSTTDFKPIELSSSDLYSMKKPSGIHAYLRIVRGPQRGVCYELGPNRLTVGRDIDCNIFLNDMTVSRCHAFIEPSGDCFQIIDNNSFNGLWINNQNCERKILQPNDVIQLGAFCLIYEER